MLAAFEDRYSSIVPFRNIIIVEVLSNTAIRYKLHHENIQLAFASKEIRDQQLTTFKQWLTIQNNSI